MNILKWFGIIISLIALYLVVVIFFLFIKVKEQPVARVDNKEEAPACRQDIMFTIDGHALSGWLYLPEDTAKPHPCIVLSQGFCGTKDMLLEKYALRFC